jgi:UDP-N-acetylmuramoyl-tripeptide--D-alanyl-D-alanine ligase
LEVIKKDTESLYSEEITLLSSPEHRDYVLLNLRKIREFRSNFNIPVVGIAGAEGKTTTKGMLSAILQQRGPLLETPLDCDSASVVTSTLLKLNEQHRYALLEMGIINREQFKLAVEISQPTLGIVTNIGEARIPLVGDKFIIADAKVELVRQLDPNGFAILNIDDELVSGMDAFSPTQRVIKYGFNTNAHFCASDLKYLGPDGLEFTLNNYYKFRLPIHNSAMVSNALAAISAARVLNFEFDEIKKGLEENYRILPGRGNFIDLDDIFILDHTYNATINAVSKACESLVQFRKFSRSLILVIGSLEDLREESEKIHLNLGYYISALPIDMVITVGRDARLIGEGIRKINHNNKIIKHCEHPEALPGRILEHLDPHTTILMMGGKSLALNDRLIELTKKLKTQKPKIVDKVNSQL